MRPNVPHPRAGPYIAPLLQLCPLSLPASGCPQGSHICAICHQPQSPGPSFTLLQAQGGVAASRGLGKEAWGLACAGPGVESLKTWSLAGRTQTGGSLPAEALWVPPWFADGAGGGRAGPACRARKAASSFPSVTFINKLPRFASKCAGVGGRGGGAASAHAAPLCPARLVSPMLGILIPNSGLWEVKVFPDQRLPVTLLHPEKLG